MPLAAELQDAIRRLDGKHLLGDSASVSVRLPGTGDMLLAQPNGEPLRISLADDADGAHRPHLEVYRARPDVGAIALGAGTYGQMLPHVAGVMPQVFDEQARHLGCSARAASDRPDDVKRSLGAGGNVWVHGHRLLVFGTTLHRLVLNAELLEKCAKAYVLAAGTGEPLHTLPWWVCRIANGRLKKDQKRAAERFAQGLLPEEVKGY
jgi:ribulose-5-phosphate 4-epimerase/fuculose-1-phosphate aldolase